jgi:hypothetical protein
MERKRTVGKASISQREPEYRWSELPTSPANHEDTMPFVYPPKVNNKNPVHLTKIWANRYAEFNFEFSDDSRSTQADKCGE